mmetsp:Transcript_25434/g.35042  ORF Transcript_25434/g.35042 Transcript_25434/m.35042 type:complete len:83 (-) Transcript_25434:200-448(-)
MIDTEDMFAPSAKKRNPLVLVGALATAGVLVSGLVAFKHGAQQRSQAMMRARVIFQGVTVALMVGSSGVYANWLPASMKSEE